MIDAMYRGVEEQHVLASRWFKGESDLADFLDRYQDWFREHLDRAAGSRSRSCARRPEPTGVGEKTGARSFFF